MANESRKNSHGIVLTGKQVAKGTQGIATTESASERISDFQEYYPQFKGNVTKKEMDAFLLFLETNDVNSALEFESWLLSNKTMQNLAQRKGIGRQAMTGGNSMDALALPDDGTEATQSETAGMDAGMGDMGGGMDTGMGDMGGGMDTGMDTGMGGAGGMDDMGTDVAGADFGTSGPDINEIGEVDKISQDTSEELPNLGGDNTATTEEENPPA